MMSQCKLYTTGEIAEILGVTPVRIRNWIDTGVLRGIMPTPGGRRVVGREDLLSFMAHHGYGKELAKLLRDEVKL